jgi:hypothetical protein
LQFTSTKIFGSPFLTVYVCIVINTSQPRIMKNVIYLGIALILAVSVSSCGSVTSIQKSENNVAGYTLKNKKELMEQKVLNKKVKTVIALP